MHHLIDEFIVMAEGCVIFQSGILLNYLDVF